MEGLKQEIVIVDFSGIYQEEQFWKEELITWLELKDISGTNCYCDAEAQAQIMEKMEKYPASGIYFIDSGNYHYMSRIGAGRVEEPFNLLVFDNHTDMQLPAFGGLLSCGGWIASSLEEAENLKEVWLIGPDEEAYNQVEEQFKSQVHFFSREKIAESREKSRKNASDIKEKWQKHSCLREMVQEIPTNLPLYISIDKDVLCQEAASTTWSQGDMTLEEMLEGLSCLIEHFEKNGGRILQVDICGECDPDDSKENGRNDRANKELLKLWKAYFDRIDGKSAVSGVNDNVRGTL